MHLIQRPKPNKLCSSLIGLIAEVIALREQVVALSSDSTSLQASVRQAEYFGMWASREDMQGRSSREWLEDLRGQQWIRR